MGRPRRLGPKRATTIRQAFVLRKQDDVRKYVVHRKIEKNVKKKDSEEEIEKTFYKAPKIQRLITEKRLRRKALNARGKKDNWRATKDAHVAYEKLLSKFLKERKAAYKESHSTKPADPKPSPASPAKPAKPAPPKKEAPKVVAPKKEEPAKTKKRKK